MSGTDTDKCQHKSLVHVNVFAVITTQAKCSRVFVESEVFGENGSINPKIFSFKLSFESLQKCSSEPELFNTNKPNKS